MEENHYYPFGMKIAALSSRKLGSSANGQLQNRFDYQGSYSKFDNRTEWNEFELRMYDAQIGRWLQGDPYDQFASPYVGMGNNPVSGVDPTGGWTGDLPEVFVTATRNTGMSGFSGFQFLTALATSSFLSQPFDFFQNAAGYRFWHDSKAAYLDYNGERWYNVGETAVDEKDGSLVYHDGHTLKSYKRNDQLSQWNPGSAYNWSKRTGFISRITYSVSDNFWVFGQTLVMPKSDVRHIGGGQVSYSERMDAFVGAGTSFVPVSLSGKAIGGVKVVASGIDDAAKGVMKAESKVFLVTKEGVVLPKGAKIPGEFIENAHRSSNYGVMQNGKFFEKLRIDPATSSGFKGPNQSHFHLNNGEHIFDASKWPWW